MTENKFCNEIYLQNVAIVAQRLADDLVPNAVPSIVAEHLRATGVAGIQLMSVAHKTAIERQARLAFMGSTDDPPDVLDVAPIAFGLADDAGRMILSDHPFVEVGVVA